MNEVTMVEKEVNKKCLAIVMFGPATPVSGTRPAEYYQVTIDPALRSKSGEYIRFGLNKSDEIHGWQKVSSMTVCEVLKTFEGEVPETLDKQEGSISMRFIE